MKELFNKLNDRKLRFDGVSEIEPDQLARFLLLGVPPEKLRVTEITDEVTQFNSQVAEHVELKGGKDPVKLDFTWQLPDSYKNLDLWQYFSEAFEKLNLPYTEDLSMKAIDRIAYELREVEARGMVEFMRTVIYILDNLKSNGVIWGVGRGSSCASYLLFLTGLHVVDCVIMDVSPDEFYHD